MRVDWCSIALSTVCGPALVGFTGVRFRELALGAIGVVAATTFLGYIIGVLTEVWRISGAE